MKKPSYQCPFLNQSFVDEDSSSRLESEAIRSLRNKILAILDKAIEQVINWQKFSPPQPPLKAEPLYSCDTQKVSTAEKNLKVCCSHWHKQCEAYRQTMEYINSKKVRDHIYVATIKIGKESKLAYEAVKLVESLTNEEGQISADSLNFKEMLFFFHTNQPEVMEKALNEMGLSWSKGK